MFQAVDASRPSLLPWMAWALDSHRSELDCAEYVERQCQGHSDPSNTDFGMGIFRRHDGELIGGTGLHCIRAPLHEAEIGYWIAGPHRGQGLCTEAVAGLVGAALRPASEGGWGLRRIIVSCAAINRGSVRVCEKLGLRLEARRRRDRYLDAYDEHPGGYIDSHTYAVLLGEWDHDRARARDGISWQPGS